LVVVFDTAEAFFLRGCNDLSVDYEASRGIVIERRYSKNAYHLNAITNLVRRACR
jgi:hypothetical protein